MSRGLLDCVVFLGTLEIWILGDVKCESWRGGGGNLTQFIGNLGTF
jgi:hypothetical protein